MTDDDGSLLQFTGPASASTSCDYAARRWTTTGSTCHAPGWITRSSSTWSAISTHPGFETKRLSLFDHILQTPDGRQLIQQVSPHPPPPPQRQQIILPPGAQVIAQAMPGQQVIVNAGNQQITLTEGAQLIRLATGQFQIIQPAPVQYANNQNQIILVSKPNRPTPVSFPPFFLSLNES